MWGHYGWFEELSLGQPIRELKPPLCVHPYHLISPLIQEHGKVTGASSGQSSQSFCNFVMF
jgi:hypothetical protein